MFTFNQTTPASNFIEQPTLNLTESEKHDQLTKLIHRIKTNQEPGLTTGAKKDFLDLVLKVEDPTIEELEMYDALLKEIFDNRLDYNIPGVTTNKNKKRLNKAHRKKQKSLSDFI